jgi:hypothetical protein
VKGKIELKKDKKKHKSSSSSSSSDGKKKVNNMKASGKIKTPKVDKPQVLGDFQFAVFDLNKKEGEIRGSIPKPKGESESNIGIPSIETPELKMKGKIELKKNKKKHKSSSSSSRSDGKKKKKGINVKASGTIKTPKVEKPHVLGYFQIVVFDLNKKQADIRGSLSKSKSENETNIGIHLIETPELKVKGKIELKKDKKKHQSSSSSSSSDGKKKNRGFNIKASGKIKTPKVEKPEIKGDLNIPVFDISPTKIEIRKSIPKSQE